MLLQNKLQECAAEDAQAAAKDDEDRDSDIAKFLTSRGGIFACQQQSL
jgi:hypothetical protein